MISGGQWKRTGTRLCRIPDWCTALRARLCKSPGCTFSQGREVERTDKRQTDLTSVRMTGKLKVYGIA